MFVLVATISRIQQLQKDSFDKYTNNLLKVFSEMQKEAVEYVDHKLENY